MLNAVFSILGLFWKGGFNHFVSKQLNKTKKALHYLAATKQ
ncbi:hypothetical protein RV18_GL002170 [Enterococcus termitis]|nr:hypothetical protein RV18_GL002170 [Enterococcus termitis]